MKRHDDRRPHGESPNPDSIPEEEARSEIASAGKRLEDIIGAPVRLFAYPNGKPAEDYSLRHVRLVRELGFDGAVTTAWGRPAMTRTRSSFPGSGHGTGSAGSTAYAC